MARKTLIQVRRDTAANWTSANPTLSAGEPGFETDTGKVKFGDGSTAWTSLAYVVTDAKMVTSDITTNDVSTSKHGFVPKAPNDTSKFLRGDGTWAAVGGVTTVIATDVFWDAAGDLAVGSGADAASRLALGASGKVLMSNGSTAVWGYPPGYEFDYVEKTSNTSITATSFASPTTIVTGAAVSYDGSTRIKIEFWAYAIAYPADSFMQIGVFDGSSHLAITGDLSNIASGSTTSSGDGTHKSEMFLTPSAASHTYSIRAIVGAGSATVTAGAGTSGATAPCWMRITKA